MRVWQALAKKIIKAKIAAGKKVKHAPVLLAFLCLDTRQLTDSPLACQAFLAVRRGKKNPKARQMQPATSASQKTSITQLPMA